MPQIRVSQIKQWLLAVGLLASLQIVAMGQPTSEGASPTPLNTMCPVMSDMRVKPEISIGYLDTRVWFCCPQCLGPFLEDPERYHDRLPQLVPGGGDAAVDRDMPSDAGGISTNSLTGQGEITPTVMNTMCPLMPDMEVNPDVFADYEGKRVYFCCPTCRQTFLQDPEAHLAKLPQFAPGGADVSGSQSRPDHSIDHDHGTHEPEHLSDEHGSEGVSTEHDHTQHHTSPSGLGRLVRFAGKFHPVVIHFPIALLLTAALADMLFLTTRREMFLDSERYLLTLAAMSVLVAVPLGWSAAWGADYSGSMSTTLWLHRWLGTVTGILTLFAFALTLGKGPASSKVAFRLALYISAALVGVTGHLGATLVYGSSHFSF